MIRKTGDQFILSTQTASVRRNMLLDEPGHNTEQLIYLRWYLNRKGDPLRRFRKSIRNLDGRTLEIIAHPAVKDEILPTISNYVNGRQHELDFLLSDRIGHILESL